MQRGRLSMQQMLLQMSSKFPRAEAQGNLSVADAIRIHPGIVKKILLDMATKRPEMGRGEVA